MTKSQYRQMLDRAIRDGDSELLDAVSAVLAENEAAKAILEYIGCGTARMPIDAMVRLVPEAKSV